MPKTKNTTILFKARRQRYIYLSIFSRQADALPDDRGSQNNNN